MRWQGSGLLAAVLLAQPLCSKLLLCNQPQLLQSLGAWGGPLRLDAAHLQCSTQIGRAVALLRASPNTRQHLIVVSPAGERRAAERLHLHPGETKPLTKPPALQRAS